jgi:hypothetical protein
MILIAGAIRSRSRPETTKQKQCVESFAIDGKSAKSAQEHRHCTMKYLLVLSLTQIIATIPALRKGNLFKRDACPKELPALPGFEFPHLIVPICKAHPDAANPNTFFPAITPGDLGRVFNFDILHDDQVCKLGFYFPRQEQLTAPSFTFFGPGTFEVLINEPGQGAESGVTSWNKQPAPQRTYPSRKP